MVFGSRFAPLAIGLGMLPALGGCLAEEGQAPFALYSASAKKTESCGGGGLLAAPEQIVMRISIRLIGGTGLHWDQGEGLLMGVVDDRGAFAVSNYLTVNLREADDEQPGCVVERRMIVEGILKGNPGVEGTYQAFDATMRNDYQAYDGTGCDDFLQGEQRIADELPCTVSYNLNALRE